MMMAKVVIKYFSQFSYQNPFSHQFVPLSRYVVAKTLQSHLTATFDDILKQDWQHPDLERKFTSCCQVIVN